MAYSTTYFSISASLNAEPGGGGETPTDYDLYYMNKDPELVAPYARYITDYQDLDSVNWKHIKYTNLVGDYGSNTVTLKWDKTSVYSNWVTVGTKPPISTDLDPIIRWANLGHSRRHAYMLDWSGNGNIVHEAIEVIYNIKTQ